MENSVNNSSDKNMKTKTFVITFLICIIFFALGLICYDKLINKEKLPVTIPGDDVVVDKVSSLDRLVINETNQIANVDGTEYKIRKELTVDGAFLLINDEMRDVGGETTAYADFAYVTNKFIIFTIVAQDGEKISYIMDKGGSEITYNDNDYQMHDFKIVDGSVYASGHIFCELDGDCPDKELVIKFENNTVDVIPKN